MTRTGRGLFFWLVCSSSNVVKCFATTRPALNQQQQQQRKLATVRNTLNTLHTNNNNNEDTNNSISPSSSSILTPVWPCGDDLDRRLIATSLPVICNFAIGPLIGATDLFWVNRMGNALAVAGQAAANQVFSSVFWLTSFLPSVTATLISRQNARGDGEGVQDAVCQALFVGMIMALVSSVVLLLNPDRVLASILTKDAPALVYAKPYLLIRSFAFLPSLISLVGFSAFRGVMDTLTPVKISLSANALNAVLDPILIFTMKMGVPGAALATLAAEISSAAFYLKILKKRKMIQFAKIFRLPKWKQLEPLLRGGAALQLRNIALNLTFLAVARVVQSIDQSGVSAAAHAISIQTFQVGGIVLLALSTVAQTVVPNDLVPRFDAKLNKQVGGIDYAKATINRLMSWGFVLGIVLGAIQLALLPVIQSSTPLQQVRDAARLPCVLASVFQIMNGLVFIGEGVMVGTGSFMFLSLSTVVATTGCLWALKTFPPIHGLAGVWMSFGVFNGLRLGGVFLHQKFVGPLAARNIERTRKLLKNI
jgi:MATE family multidrug resistance protein